jgi:hypothetical protein
VGDYVLNAHGEWQSLPCRLEGSSFCFIISSVLLGDKKVVRLRKRPKKTSSKAKTTREPFGNKVVKGLEIPAIADGYNYYIGAVNKFDHLTAQNTSLCHVKQEGHQVLEY